ncbi:MAG: murein biosynthesis integral membrane protein MurJ [Phycisphaerae bacterium]|nr:murein biosynthesis integral membrane protein MurJ [Phycisphaerae bacterium]
MIKGFRQIAVLSAASRGLGMVRDMAYACFWGRTGLTDLWLIAFTVPNLALRVLGEGALSSSFIPVYLEELRSDPKRAHRLASTVTSVLWVILSGCVLAGELAIGIALVFWARSESARMLLCLTAVMLPYMVLVSATAVLGGILNAHRHFAAPAAAPAVLNLVIIGTLAVTGWRMHLPPERQVFLVAAGVLVAGVLECALQWPPLRARGVRIRPAWAVDLDSFRRVFILMIPMVLGLTVTQVNTLVNSVMAWAFSGSAARGEFFSLWGHLVPYPLREGAVSSLYYAQRLYQFPLGVLGISLATAIYPVLSADAGRGDRSAVCRTVARGVQSAVFVSVPATAGILLMRRALVSALFEQGRFTSEDTPLVAFVLLFYTLGLCGYFTQQVLIRAFYSMQDPSAPLRSAVVAVAANVAASLTLIWFMGAAGLAAATALCAYVQVVLLGRALRERLGAAVWEGVASTLARTLLATLVMAVFGLAVLFLMRRLPEDRVFNVLRVVAVVPCGAAVFLAAARVLRIEALSLVLGSLGRRPGVRGSG